MTETSNINRKLGEFQERLSDLNLSSDLIDKAKEGIENARKLTEKIITESKEISESLIQQSRKATDSAIEESKKLHQSTLELHNLVAQLMKKLDKVDFPARLDKLDSTVSTINQGLQNVISRLETFERHVGGEIKKYAEDVEKDLTKLNENIETKLASVHSAMENNLRKNRRYIISIGIAVLLIFLFLILDKFGVINFIF